MTLIILGAAALIVYGTIAVARHMLAGMTWADLAGER